MKKRENLLLIASCALYTIASAVDITMSLFLGQILDSAEQGKQQQLFFTLLLCIVASLAGLLIVKTGIYFRMLYVKRKVVHLKDLILQNILKMPLKDFLRNDQAYYTNILTGDIDKIEEDYYRSLPLIFYQCFRLLFAVAAFLIISPSLLLVFAASFLITAGIPQLLSKPLVRRQKESSQSNEEFLLTLVDVVSGVETVRLSGSEKEIQNRFHLKNLGQQEKSRRLRDLKTFTSELSNSCETLAQIICMGFGGLLVIAGKVSIGSLVVTIQLANYAFQSLAVIVEKSLSLRSVSDLLKKIRALTGMAVPPDTPDPNFTASGIQYKNVSFAFGEKVILKDFSQFFLPGKTYGIIGPSGSGKSTLIKLLLQYYDEYDGLITLDGADIRQVPTHSLYRKVKYVQQFPHIFNATLKENITLFREYPEQVVQSVIQQTNLTELFARYGDQPIGDDGGRISGGEKQRIALARALLEKPEIIIFDEPASSLDPINAEVIMRLIFSMEGYTRIVITHNQDEHLLSQFDQVLSLQSFPSTLNT